MAGKPWERIEGPKLRDLVSEDEEFHGESLKRQNLKELKEMFEEDLRWVLEDDVDVEDDDCLLPTEKQMQDLGPSKRWRNEKEAIRFLVDRFRFFVLSFSFIINFLYFSLFFFIIIPG